MLSVISMDEASYSDQRHSKRLDYYSTANGSGYYFFEYTDFINQNNGLPVNAFELLEGNSFGFFFERSLYYYE